MKDGKEVELHTWDGPQDPDNPYVPRSSTYIHLLTKARFNWSTKYKGKVAATNSFEDILLTSY